MAKKSVNEFKIERLSDSVLVVIHTENKKPFKYKIYPDLRHTCIDKIASHLSNGLEVAKDSHKKIDISDYEDRRYVHIVTPVPNHSDQYTADKIK